MVEFEKSTSYDTDYTIDKLHRDKEIGTAIEKIKESGNIDFPLEVKYDFDEKKIIVIADDAKENQLNGKLEEIGFSKKVKQSK